MCDDWSVPRGRSVGSFIPWGYEFDRVACAALDDDTSVLCSRADVGFRWR